jgi:general secretion pathway protein D
LGRIIGLIGCTCLVIAVLRLSNMEHVNDTLRAGVDKSPASKVQSAREKFRSGKELYLKGRYADAALALESAAGNASGLTAAERRQAQDYLKRAHAKLNGLSHRGSTLRGQSPEEDEFSRPVRQSTSKGQHHDVTRTRVERRMLEAQAALQQGKTAEARQMVVQAAQMAKDAQLKFSPGELTPAQLLAKIDGVAGTTPKAGGIRHAGGPFADEQQSAVQLTDGVELEDAPAEEWSEGEVAEETEDAAEGSELSNEALARKLVASARADLKAGRFEEARRKALQADELDVAWSLFEDQPILILEADSGRRGPADRFDDDRQERGTPQDGSGIREPRQPRRRTRLVEAGPSADRAGPVGIRPGKGARRAGNESRLQDV